ncbi:MAG: hypothetical protein JWR67_581 [Mucilaginibacter sp.]|nr:hypothetical protein [Mucilaginibacter sp.]
MHLTNKSKSVIELLLCGKHKQRPVVIFDQEKIKLECCCVDFKVQCFHLIKKMTFLRFPPKIKV